MALLFEFVLLQIAISIVGYVVHQYFDFPIKRVLLVAGALSIITPFVMLDVRTADLSAITMAIENLLTLLPEQFIGFVIGFIVTGAIHAGRSVLEHFGIEIR